MSNASDSLGDAHDVLGGWWTVPAHLVPFVSQQLDALSSASHQGHDVAAAGALVAAKADYHQLRYVQGQIDVPRLRQLDAPAGGRQPGPGAGRHPPRRRCAHRGWSVPSDGAVDDFRDDVAQTVPQAQVAQQAVAVAPGMLGGDGTRHYFVAFTTEAESRGLNGFMGNWAELTATNGRLTMSRSGRVAELNAKPGAAQRVVTSPTDYAARYSRFKVGTYFQDVTLSPDLPDVAQVIRQLYSGPFPDMGGDKIDGVLVVDPYGLAALLRFTGPIDVTGGPQLTAANAAQELVSDQYTDFPGKTDRVDFLDQASRETFDKLTKGTIPGPDQIASVLGPQVSGHHLMFTSFRGSEEALFTRLGATGAYPRAQPDQDFFGVTGQNSANNKTDVWMHRTIDYDASYDPSTGRVEAKATITLRNDAPSSGLPDGVIGSNGQGLPLGTNRTYLSFYTPLQLACVGRGRHAPAVRVPTRVRISRVLSVSDRWFRSNPDGDPRSGRGGGRGPGLQAGHGRAAHGEPRSGAGDPHAPRSLAGFAGQGAVRRARRQPGHAGRRTWPRPQRRGSLRAPLTGLPGASRRSGEWVEVRAFRPTMVDMAREMRQTVAQLISDCVSAPTGGGVL